MNIRQTGPSLRDKIHIDPARVESATLRGYDKRADRGTVQDGDWDLNTKAIEGADFHQDELPDRRETHYALVDDVSVCIDRHGHFILEAGRQRFCSARLLDINSIPVRVSVRHRDWMNFRDEVIAYAAQHNGRVYAPLRHPDLAAIPSAHGHKRFETLLARLSAREERLSISEPTGATSATDSRTRASNAPPSSGMPYASTFLNKLRVAERKRFEVFSGSIFEYQPTERFALVLALNILHHFLRTEEAFAQLEALLPRLDTDAIAFEPHIPTEPQMEGAYRNLSPSDFVGFVFEHSDLTKATQLDGAEDGRPVYLLTR